jgi:hypothetical protein
MAGHSKWPVDEEGVNEVLHAFYVDEHKRARASAKEASAKERQEPRDERTGRGGGEGREDRQHHRHKRQRLNSDPYHGKLPTSVLDRLDRERIKRSQHQLSRIVGRVNSTLGVSRR